MSKTHNCKYRHQGDCSLLVSPLCTDFLAIYKAFKEHFPDREIVPNGECFWDDDEFGFCPRYKPYPEI